ncbi:transporter [Actibacterium mucosum KCTC 23349]|uniref:Transporter n=1 Tax=Actibacterium mucosum KCTC 23349 TaxID=1454373 RepID=A0A037ZE03_9RHOB|nr:MFS transporter [Actibacterium mucosum]KAJ54724.1 transporter [Actibacterium mucosum KCTC 23349]
MSNLRTPWRAVSAMFVLNGALYGIWAARIPAIAEKHALGPGRLGLLLLLLAMGAILSFPLAGRAADRFGAYHVTLRIAVAYVAALIAIAWAPGLWTVAIALFLFGATHGAMDVAMNTWASEVERHIGRPVMSSFHAMFSVGAGLGAGTGVLAAWAAIGPSIHFTTAGVAAAVLTLAFGWIGWAKPEGQVDHSGTILAIPRGALAAVGMLAFCAALGEGAMADWSAIFLVLTTQVTEAKAALGYTVFSVAMVVMRFLGDRVIRWAGPVKAARMAGAFTLAGIVFAVGFGTYGAVLTGFALLGFGYAVIFPLAFSRAANDPAMAPGAAIASVATLGYGGLLLGPPVIGFVAELTSLRVAFGLLGGLAVLIVVLAQSLRPPHSAGQTTATAKS